MLKFVVLLLLVSCTGENSLNSLKTLRKSIFKIQVISKEPQPGQPWLMNSRRTSYGSGFYIGRQRIMTNAHVVAHGKYITVQRDGEADPKPARVEYIAHDSDLAILLVDHKELFEGSRRLEFGEMPSLRDKVATIGYPKGGEQISITEGVVSRISYRRYVHPGYERHLLVQVDSAINSGNSGGPVIKGDKVIGVAFQSFTNAENTGYIIPTPVVERFLKDIDNGYYDGHPEDGLVIFKGATENQGTSAYHGLTKPEGVKVSLVTPFSALYNKILPGDIITKINHKPIGVDGKVEQWGERLNFKVIYDLAQIGEELVFEVLRDRQPKTIKVTVSQQRNHYSPASLYTERPRYVVFGGLVFTALSRDYLKVWGSQWYYNAPLNLRYIHKLFYSDPQFARHEDIVILAGILPSRVNIDADPFKEKVLDSFNGQQVHSLDDLKKMIESSQAPLIEMKFLLEHQPLVLSKNELDQVHEQLLDQYKVEPAFWLGTRDDDGAIGVKSQ